MSSTDLKQADNEDERRSGSPTIPEKALGKVRFLGRGLL